MGEQQTVHEDICAAAEFSVTASESCESVRILYAGFAPRQTRPVRLGLVLVLLMLAPIAMPMA
ncbi:MAG: hypothetical protein QGH90_04410, partial [Candidatus Poseidoniaceae archaeon]|nr:hypothetical protein [Candidatus Poseidoniaceae archaeon]